MLSRALIVLLIVLNAGVALWWATRPVPVPVQSADAPGEGQDSGIARLQLLREVPRSALALRPAPAPPPTPAPPPAAATAATPEASVTQRCYAIGPFTDAATLAAARAQLQPQVAALRTREAPVSSASGWRVMIPPLADRSVAQIMVERLKAAGFDDYLIVPEGDEANSIALGRYGGEKSARQREAALRAAGFEAAQAQPLGTTAVRSWLDITVADAAFDPARARQSAGAAQASVLDCAALR
jgi:hypothetical protein